MNGGIVIGAVLLGGAMWLSTSLVAEVGTRRDERRNEAASLRIRKRRRSEKKKIRAERRTPRMNAMTSRDRSPIWISPKDGDTEGHYDFWRTRR